MPEDTVAEFDVSEVLEFAATLSGAGARAKREIDRVIKRGAQNIMTDARKRVRSQIRGLYLPHYASSITYEMLSLPEVATAEIGPEQSRGGMGREQGAFGPGIEFGSANHAPIPHLIPAFEKEVPRTEAALAAILPRLVVDK